MQFETVIVERRGKTAWIFHNRPQVRNAESRQLLDEMDFALTEALADDEICAIVFAGKGDHCSAGHDLKEAQASRANFTVEERYSYEEKRYFEYALRIWDCPKPTIASVQGACVAGGFMVAQHVRYGCGFERCVLCRSGLSEPRHGGRRGARPPLGDGLAHGA
ncbi:enoyl-CoA hydratase/isomerase family protein [Bradyrhizobium sp. WSM 1738]|uniref:enoyl-CoA hydratase-related protein n=1 Tax=Bradyrhizobium hereditatis TaxID=2821405 RepID=UPI0035DA9E8F|nr:enoyl-CoA hydratase/isomerase family protein [Bradyrhizobium hereditatis]